VKYNRFFIYTPFYATHLQVRLLTIFSRLMAQMMLTRSRKGVPFGLLVDIAAHIGHQICPKTPVLGVNRHFPAKHAKY